MATNCLLELKSQDGRSTWQLFINPEWNYLDKGWQLLDDNPFSLTTSGRTQQLPSLMVLLYQGRQVGTLEGFVLETAKEGDTGYLRTPSGTSTYIVTGIESVQATDTMSSALGRIKMSP